MKLKLGTPNVAGEIKMDEHDAGLNVSGRMATTLAPDSRQGSRLEWCSRGPTRTVT